MHRGQSYPLVIEAPYMRTNRWIIAASLKSSCGLGESGLSVDLGWGLVFGVGRLEGAGLYQRRFIFGAACWSDPNDC